MSDREVVRRGFRQWDAAAKPTRNLTGARCQVTGCGKPATYLIEISHHQTPGQILERRTYCAEHAEDGMVTTAEQMRSMNERPS